MEIETSGQKLARTMSDRNGKDCLGVRISTIVMILLGLLLSYAIIILGLGISGGIHVFFLSSMREFLVVDSENSPGYEDWKTNDNDESAPLYLKFYFWNWTNVDSFKQRGSNHRIEVTRVGPYSYRKYFKKFDVEFLNEGELVSYHQDTFYRYDAANSGKGLDPAKDEIVTLSTAYLAVLAASGGESGLLTGVGLEYLSSVTKKVAPIYASLMSSLDVQQEVTSQHFDRIIAYYVGQGMSSSEAMDAFLLQWRTGITTNESASVWEGFYTLRDVGVTMGTINAKKLWEAGCEKVCFRNNGSLAATLWITLQQDPRALAAAAGIGEPGVRSALVWREKHLMAYGASRLAASNVTSSEEYFALQWGEMGVSSTPITQLFPALDLGAPFEFPLYQPSPNVSIQLPRKTSFALLLSKKNISSVANFQALHFAYVKRNKAALAAWELDLQLAEAVLGYVKDVLMQTIANAKIGPIIQGGGGLIGKHTVDEWLWGYEDKLLAALGRESTIRLYYKQSPFPPKVPPTVVYTGKRHVDNVAKYYKWQGLEELPAGKPWPKAYPVHGRLGTNFALSLKMDSKIDVFAEEVMRVLIMSCNDEEVMHKGIDMLRFRLDDSMFDPDWKFYQSITGFANMTKNNENTPVFFSVPGMLGADKKYSSVVKVRNGNPDEYDTHLDVEPITGLVMSVAKRLQLNVFLGDASNWFDVYSEGFKSDVMVPMLYASEESVITSKLASQFKWSVYLLVILQDVLLYSVTVAGGLISCACFLCFFGWCLFTVHWVVNYLVSRKTY